MMITDAVTTFAAAKQSNQMGSAPKPGHGGFEDIGRPHQTLSNNHPDQIRCISELSVGHGNPVPAAALTKDDTDLDNRAALQQIDGPPFPAESAGRTFQNVVSKSKLKRVRSQQGFKKRKKEKDEIDKIFGD